MIARLYCPLVVGLLPIALIACINSAPTIAEEGAVVPLGIDLGGSGPVTASPPLQPAAYAMHREGTSSEHSAGMQMTHAGHNDAHRTSTSMRSIRRSTKSISATSRSLRSAGRQ